MGYERMINKCKRNIIITGTHMAEKEIRVDLNIPSSRESDIQLSINSMRRGTPLNVISQLMALKFS